MRPRTRTAPPCQRVGQHPVGPLGEDLEDRVRTAGYGLEDAVEEGVRNAAMPEIAHGVDEDQARIETLITLDRLEAPHLSQTLRMQPQVEAAEEAPRDGLGIAAVAAR